MKGIGNILPIKHMENALKNSISISFAAISPPLSSKTGSIDTIKAISSGESLSLSVFTKNSAKVSDTVVIHLADYQYMF